MAAHSKAPDVNAGCTYLQSLELVLQQMGNGKCQEEDRQLHTAPHCQFIVPFEDKGAPLSAGFPIESKRKY